MPAARASRSSHGKPSNDKTRRQGAPQTLGFGVPATSDPHHFKVIIPKANTGRVQISEYLGLQTQSAELSVIDRLLLERPRWTAIRAEVQRAFNARLKAHNLKTAAWKVGENPVDRLLGKELCVLAWAVEGMEMDKIPVAVRNWLALRPEGALVAIRHDRHEYGRHQRWQQGLAVGSAPRFGRRGPERATSAPSPQTIFSAGPGLTHARSVR